CPESQGIASPRAPSSRAGGTGMRTGRLRTGMTLVLAMAAIGRAATITVNSTADSLAPDGNCTLREAILAANSDAAVDACPAGSGPDMVIVPAPPPGQFYQLTGEANEDGGLTGDLDVTDDLELVGAGAARTLIRAPANIFHPSQDDRVLDVDPAGAGISVRVSGVTLRGVFGVDEGGAIRNRGTLIIADSVVEGNKIGTGFPAARTRGGGILSQGSLRIERSIIRDNVAGLGNLNPAQPAGLGGGICALGPLEVIDSTIAGNAAVSSDTGPGIGGGISAAGPVSLVRSTVSGNTASTGGGLAADAATLVNSTISGNTGGGIVAGGTVELSNATITENV